MDPERKKRKMVKQDEEDNDNDDDDQEMEKFFALIKSNRELREHMNNIKNSVESSSNNQNKQKGHGENMISGAWYPSFQPEDFMEDHHHHHQLYPSTSAPLQNPKTESPKTECSKREVEEGKKGGENGDNHGGLDLNVEEDKKEDKEGDGNDGFLDLNLSL